MTGKKKKFKLVKNNKFLIGVISAATIMVGGIKLHQVREYNDQVNSNMEYTVGYDDVNIFTNFLTKKVTDDNFVMLNIEDYEHMFLQRMKLDYCSIKGIDLGLVLSFDSASQEEVLLDFEYLLSIMEKYKIKYPVYLNVDKMLGNSKLTREEAIDYIHLFVKKAALNNIYIALIGDSKYYDDELLDLGIGLEYLTTDENNYRSGKMRVKDGVYYAEKDFVYHTDQYGLNNSNVFLEDGYHVVLVGDTLNTIAEAYGASVDTLKSFNKIGFGGLEEGDVLRIPTTVQVGKNFQKVDDDKYFIRRGIGLSCESDVSWDEVFDRDFALIRIYDFKNNKVDDEFMTNVEACLVNDIKMGFYAGSYDSTIANILKEYAYRVVDELNKIDNVCYPIYLGFDEEFWDFYVEEIDGNSYFCLRGYTVSETRQIVMNIIKTWESVMTEAGYIPGIYINNDDLYLELSDITYGYIKSLSLCRDYSKDGVQYINMVIPNSLDNTVYGLNKVINGSLNPDKGYEAKYRDCNSRIELDDLYFNYRRVFWYDNPTYEWERKEFNSNWLNKDVVSHSVALGTGIGVGSYLTKKKRRIKGKNS